jgi:hypothetical protein
MKPLHSPEFNKFCRAVNKAKKVTPYEGTILALDPGETTGYSVFHAASETIEMVASGQVKTWPMKNCVTELANLLNQKPTLVVHEVYSIYEWKTDTHAWSDVPTLRVIGSLETLCIQAGIPYISQTAQVAKGFCTDEKLKAWGFYQQGQKHARDAIRHGLYFLLFGTKLLDS